MDDHDFKTTKLSFNNKQSEFDLLEYLDVSKILKTTN